ncbi:hypothetical protein HMPREF3231_01362 [Bifidobacterium longum]|nr:hypothetical protein HMPREF3231_01362 [Bifidobacterium longum]
MVRHIMPHTRCSVCMGQACPAPISLYRIRVIKPTANMRQGS